MNVFQRIQQRIALCGGLGAIALQHWGTVMFFIFVFVVLVCAASALFSHCAACAAAGLPREGDRASQRCAVE